MIPTKKDKAKIFVIIISFLLHLIVFTILLLNYKDGDKKKKISPPQKKQRSAPVVFQGMRPSTPKPSPINAKKSALQTQPKKTEKKAKNEPKKTIKAPKEQKKQAKPAKKAKPIKATKIKEIKKIKPEIPKAKVEAKKLSLADFSKGFLNYAKKNGANLISYTHCAEGMPTEEQLKHERYIQKIFKQIDTSLKIRRRAFVLNRRPNNAGCFILDIQLILNKNGGINNLRLVKSSGSNEFDIFMIGVLQNASSSFPSIPKYFKQENYFLPIRFSIGSRMFSH